MKGYAHEVWWMMLLKGIALLLLGIAALVWPGLTLVTLSILFAVFLLVAGVFNIIMGIGNISQNAGWFLSILLGILEIGAGVYLLKIPLLSAATLILVIGITFIIQGIIAIIAAFTDTDDTGMRVLAICVGILGLIAGFLVLRYPLTSGIAYVWILGAYGIIAGAIEIARSLSFKSTNDIDVVATSRKTTIKR